MKELLTLIETVSPDDEALLDEIDARVWCYLGGDSWGRVEPVKFISFGEHTFPDHDEPTQSVLTFSYKGKYPHEKEYRDCVERFRLSKTYTRSRDALKAIRPDGWFISVTAYIEGLFCVTLCNKTGFKTSYTALDTEELAELHAIIQDIEYERIK